MAARNDAGLNKGGFVLLKRIGTLSELVHGVLPSDEVQNRSGIAQTELCSHTAPGSLLASPGSQGEAPGPQPHEGILSPMSEHKHGRRGQVLIY